MADTVIVRVKSHRAYGRLKLLLGVDSLEEYWNPWDGNGFVAIPADRLAEARAIPSITLARPKRELMRCWKMTPGR